MLGSRHSDASSTTEFEGRRQGRRLVRSTPVHVDYHNIILRALRWPEGGDALFLASSWWSSRPDLRRRISTPDLGVPPDLHVVTSNLRHLCLPPCFLRAASWRSSTAEETAGSSYLHRREDAVESVYPFRSAFACGGAGHPAASIWASICCPGPRGAEAVRREGRTGSISYGFLRERATGFSACREYRAGSRGKLFAPVAKSRSPCCGRRPSSWQRSNLSLLVPVAMRSRERYMRFFECAEGQSGKSRPPGRKGGLEVQQDNARRGKESGGAAFVSLEPIIGFKLEQRAVSAQRHRLTLANGLRSEGPTTFLPCQKTSLSPKAGARPGSPYPSHESRRSSPVTRAGCAEGLDAREKDGGTPPPLNRLGRQRSGCDCRAQARRRRRSRNCGADAREGAALARLR